jgi:hypothetical protein
MLYALTVARCILLPGDHRLWVEEFTVLARSNFVNDIWFKVDVKRTRNVFPRRCFRKERAKPIGAISPYNVTTLETAVWLGIEKRHQRHARRVQ